MSASPIAALRAEALAARAAGERERALALFCRAGDDGDPWSRADAALELLALGRGPAARAEAEALLADRPHFAPAHRTLALIARRDGRHEEALTRFRAAADLDPSDLWNRHDAAEELRALGRAEEAETALRALVAGTPLPHALRALARAARDRGEEEAALAALLTAADLLPADPWFALEAAEALDAQGRTDAAEARLRTLAERHPTFAEAPRRLARLARRRGDGLEELAHWRRVAALDGDTGVLDLSDSLLERGETAEAETLLARRLATGAPSPRALRLFARAARLAGDDERAHAHSRAAARLVPADASARAELAADALRLGRIEEAEAHASAALHLDPGCLAARRTLALAARARGNDALALRIGREAWASGEGPARAGFDLAADLRAASRFGEAGEVYEALLSRDDDAPEALVELALLARRGEGGVEAARRRLEEALERDPAHPRALLCLADLEREAGHLDLADALYGRVLAARPRFVWAIAGQALVAEARGDREAADERWRAAISADPTEAHPRIALAVRLAERGEADAAEALLNALPPTSPRAAEAAMASARIRRAAGDAAGALEAFHDVARRWPNHAESLVEAADDALRLGRASDALGWMADAERRAPDHPALLEARARHALARDDLDEAAALFARAGSVDPGRLWPWLAQARIAALQGDADASRALFARTLRRFGPRAEIALAAADIERQLGHPAAAERWLDDALARFPRHSHLAVQAALSAIETGRLERAEALLRDAPAHTVAERGRVHFARAQLASARWDFDAAIRDGETAVALLPFDGWIRNRLAHASLLALDTDRAERVLAEAAALEAGSNRLRGKSANPSQSHYGQLLDEFRLDADALAVLREALARPVPERLAALRRAVTRFPDSTAAAIQFLVEARRADALPARLGAGDGAVPRVVHQFWTDPEIPADVAAHMATWPAMNPDLEHRVWSDASARGFLAAHAPPAVGAAYGRAREPAMKADLFRLALLHHEGGVWVDADDRCLRSVEPLLARGAGLLAYQEDLGSLGNNWLAVRPRHPVLGTALAQASEAVNRGDGDILWLATGPGLLTRVAASACCAATREADDLVVLDRSEFLAHVAIHCLAAYKTSDRHWSRTAFGRGRAPEVASRQAARTAT